MTPNIRAMTSVSADDTSLAVIIPTLGRSTLGAAVISAVTQDPSPIEVIIVVDGPDAAVVPAVIVSLPQVRVIVTGGGRGPSGARMDGVRASTSSVVAFLDDDDEWLPGKLRAQLDLFSVLRERCAFPVISCRAYVITNGGSVKEIAPTTIFNEGDSLPAFMFNRRKVLADGFVMGSSTLLASRALLQLEPWKEQLRLHEDWEWLLRVSRRNDSIVVMHDDPLIRYLDQAPENAASRPRGGWRASLAFADDSGFTPRTRGDFLLCVTAGMAIAHGERLDAARVALLAARTARAGIKAWLVFGLQMFFSERFLSRLASRLRILLQSARRRSSTSGVV
jgi:glycosyltransferase involved in cell wall biosynthesis